jgi:GxxExxY protein
VGYEFEVLSGRVIEAAIEVHKHLGPGFLEGIYHKALCVALKHRQIPFALQKEVRIVFEGEEVGFHRLDLVAGDEIVVELKAIKALEDIPLPK